MSIFENYGGCLRGGGVRRSLRRNSRFIWKKKPGSAVTTRLDGTWGTSG